MEQTSTSMTSPLFESSATLKCITIDDTLGKVAHVQVMSGDVNSPHAKSTVEAICELRDKLHEGTDLFGNNIYALDEVEYTALIDIVSELQGQLSKVSSGLLGVITTLKCEEINGKAQSKCIVHYVDEG